MAYKHSRWNSGKLTEKSCAIKCREYSKQTFQHKAEYSNTPCATGENKTEYSIDEKSLFLQPPLQIAKVIAALNDYLHKMDIMKLSKQALLRSVMEMCSSKWHSRHELGIYLEDQAEIWQLTRLALQPLMNRLKEYESQIADAQTALDNYQSRQTELLSMTAEYENMQRRGKIPQAQATQIKFMVAESERAMCLIKADTQKKLLTFLRSRDEIAKEFLEKFEDAMHMTYTESLQIVDLIVDTVGCIPKKKLNAYSQSRDDAEFVSYLLEKITVKVHEEFMQKDMSTTKPKTVIDDEHSQGDTLSSPVSKVVGSSNVQQQSRQKQECESRLSRDQNRVSSETVGVVQSHEQRRPSIGPAYKRAPRGSVARRPSSDTNQTSEQQEQQEMHASRSEQSERPLSPDSRTQQEMHAPRSEQSERPLSPDNRTQQDMHAPKSEQSERPLSPDNRTQQEMHASGSEQSERLFSPDNRTSAENIPVSYADEAYPSTSSDHPNQQAPNLDPIDRPQYLPESSTGSPLPHASTNGPQSILKPGTGRLPYTSQYVSEFRPQPNTSRPPYGSSDGLQLTATPDHNRPPYRTRTLQLDHRTCEPIPYASMYGHANDTANCNYGQGEGEIRDKDDGLRYSIDEPQPYQEPREVENVPQYAGDQRKSKGHFPTSDDTYPKTASVFREYDTRRPNAAIPVKEYEPYQNTASPLQEYNTPGPNAAIRVKEYDPNQNTASPTEEYDHYQNTASPLQEYHMPGPNVAIRVKEYDPYQNNSSPLQEYNMPGPNAAIRVKEYDPYQNTASPIEEYDRYLNTANPAQEYQMSRPNADIPVKEYDGYQTTSSPMQEYDNLPNTASHMHACDNYSNNTSPEHEHESYPNTASLIQKYETRRKIANRTQEYDVRSNSDRSIHGTEYRHQQY